MTISNETKVGSLTAIAIVLLVLGFNFLKGKNLTAKNIRYYATFENIQGLASSSPVSINGKQVGTVYETDGGTDMRRIIVTMNMSQKVNIPDNSVAVVSSSLLGVTAVDIKLGNSASFYKTGDTIASAASGGLLEGALQRVDPVLVQVKNAAKSLDSVLNAVNSILNTETKNNIQATLLNLNKTTSGLVATSASLQTLLNAQTGSLAKTLNNASEFTAGLKNQNDKIDHTLANLETTTGKLAKLDLEATLNALNGTITDLKNTIGKVNSKDGSLGLLLNDSKLYTNLNATSNKLNLLLDDVRMHPKRYINISVFGKKTKDGPLMVPLPDTVNAPYLQQ